MNTVYLELHGEVLYLEAPSEITRYVNTFERLASLALDADGTAKLLDQIERAPDGTRDMAHEQLQQS